jgi:hypothetical protein
MGVSGMSMEQIWGVLAIFAAYGLTWYLLLKSTKIVSIIDREGLEHASEIKARLKNRASRRRQKPEEK